LNADSAPQKAVVGHLLVIGGSFEWS